MEMKPFRKMSKENADHYRWSDNCDGWHFLRSDTLSVIREKMPPHTREQLHYHNNVQQFFYVLSGNATFEVDNVEVHVAPDEGIHISRGVPHRIRNDREDDLHFVVISEPMVQGDRVNIEE